MKRSRNRFLACLLIFVCLCSVHQAFADPMYIQGWSDEDDAYQLFIQSHPNDDIQTSLRTYGSTDQLISQFITGGTDLDVFAVTTSSFNTQQLFAKGYCLDLSQDETITAQLQQMYPSITALLSNPDGIFAVPWSMDLSYYAYCPDTWEEAGLDTADAPTDFTAFLDFLEAWADRITEEPEDEIFVCTQFDEELYDESSYTNYLVEMLLENYIMQYNYAGESLCFDTPVFRALLARCKQIGDALYCLEPRQKSGLALFQDSAGMQNLAYLVPLRMTADQPVLIKADLHLYAVYAGSDHQALGIEFLKTRLACISGQAGAYLYQDAAPVENPQYAETVAFWQEQVDSIQQQLNAVTDTESELYYALNSTLNRYTAAFTYVSQAENQYLITQETLDLYHSYGQQLYFQAPSVFDPNEDEGQNVQQLCKRFATGALPEEQFIQQLDQLAYMLESEAE